MSHISFHSTWNFSLPLLPVNTHSEILDEFNPHQPGGGSNFNQIIITQAIVFCDLRIQTKTLRDSASCEAVPIKFKYCFIHSKSTNSIVYVCNILFCPIMMLVCKCALLAYPYINVPLEKLNQIVLSLRAELILFLKDTLIYIVYIL